VDAEIAPLRIAGWESQPAAPGKKYNKGSFLVGNGTDVLYAHAAKLQQLYRFDIDAGAWSADTLRGMPFVSKYSGRSKKSGDGSSAAWSGDGFYALKGGNTQEYYRYCVAGDSWHELDTMPQWGRLTGKKRKVKAGGDLASYEEGVLFALKGNRTLEFWCWKDWPETYGSQRLGRDGVSASSFDIRNASFSIGPNPLRSGLLFVSVPSSFIPHPSSLSVYDALGRRVRSFDIRHSSFDIDLRSLPAGTYLIRLEAGTKSATRKLVIER